jgi:predicted methyltransferase
MKKLTLLISVAFLSYLIGCVSTTSRQGTSVALDGLLAAEHRSTENRARDRYRHPKETLLFFGVRANMAVVEVWPGSGWYSEILAPLLREQGQYYAATFPADTDSPYLAQVRGQYQEKLNSQPQLYDKVLVTSFGSATDEVAPAGSADLVLSFRNLHNWMAAGWATEALRAMHRALKPGGVLGIVEHRGDPNVPQDAQAKSGYVNEDYAIKLIEAQGFKLVAKSEVNRNDKDTKNYEHGVWTLPPTYRLGDQDRDKYAAIGESDRFTLKFIKPQT